jgi:hypothetical protein
MGFGLPASVASRTVMQTIGAPPLPALGAVGFFSSLMT